MDSWKIWTVFAVGVGAGAIVALIYAPQSGAKTRKQIKRNFDDAADYLQDAAETIGDRAEKVIKRGRDVVDDLTASANKVVKTVSQAI